MARVLGLSLLVMSAAGIAFAGNVVVPEVDATTGVAALGLLGGGILILRSRKKKS